MNLTPVFSIIVPVYNTEKYLVQCLDSLKAQTLKNMEFVLIDDGSTDGSLKVLQKYAEEDTRFRVIHQENRGYAMVRNRGLSEAHGDFIGFVDSDDWVEPDMFEVLYNQIQENPEIDMVSCSFFYEFVEQHVSIPVVKTAYIQYLKGSCGSFHGAEALLFDDCTIWNRIFRKKMLEENTICFDPSMNFGEDAFFYWTSLCSARKIAMIPNQKYHYRQNRVGSQVNSRDRRVFSYFQVMCGFEKWIKQHSLEYLQPWINHLWASYPSWAYSRLFPELRHEFFLEYSVQLQNQNITIGSPIAFPPFCKEAGFAFTIRYCILRIINPLILWSILSNHQKIFDMVIGFREALRKISMVVLQKK